MYLVYDLPQLYSRPSAQSLIEALQLLCKKSPTLDATLKHEARQPPASLVDPAGVPQYLTSIIASPLAWLPEDEREPVWEAASKRLSERSGRTALPSMTRSFHVNNDLTLHLFEPSLTEDSLGLKTWTSSVLLARRLESLSRHIPNGHPRILELGAGTGLVGLAAASIWQHSISEVVLTDLPEIVPNLTSNIELNSDNDSTTDRAKVHSRVLDWTDESDIPTSAEPSYPLIVAADPIYSIDHPRMLLSAVTRWLRPNLDSRFILELPLRLGYEKERQDLRKRLHDLMDLLEEGTETGYDDWEAADGQAAEVECWWSVWHPRCPA